ncbi:MAG: peptide ABC transporter substrate-binding protein [Thermoleophilia bacterium]
MALALVAAGLGAVGCGSGDDDDAGRGGTLVDAEDGIPPILNVMLADGATITGQRIASNIQQGLLTVDDTGAYVPQLAEAVPSGADVATGPLRVTYRLHPEARWSDGEQVTSADVVFTWRTVMDPDNAVPSRAGWEEITAITPGRAVGDGECPAATCFTIAFRGDYAPWREVFNVAAGGYVLPRHVLRGEDFNTVWNDGGIIGSGPFTLGEYQPRVRAVLEADPDWWGAPEGEVPGVARIVVDFLQGPAAAITALRQGQAGMASPPPDPALIRRARGIDGVEVQAVPSVFFEHVALNTQQAPLDDPAVRRALTMAIDRQEIVDVLLEGQAPVLQSVLRPFQLGFAATYDRYPHDPAAAAAELEAAGWTRDGDGIFQKDGQDLEIPLATLNDSELRVSTARLLAEQAAEAGIRVVPRPQSPDRVYGSLATGDFTATMFATGGPVDPSLTGLLATAAIPSEENGFAGQNVYRWSDLEADRLMRLSDRQIDDDARAATLVTLQEVVAEGVPLIPLYQQPNTVAYVAGLAGVRQNPSLAEVFWNSGEWSLAP